MSFRAADDAQESQRTKHYMFVIKIMKKKIV